MNIEGIPNPKRRKTPKMFLPQMYKMAVIGLNFPCFGKKNRKILIEYSRVGEMEMRMC